jgi:hypothetical protein
VLTSNLELWEGPLGVRITQCPNLVSLHYFSSQLSLLQFQLGLAMSHDGLVILLETVCMSLDMHAEVWCWPAFVCMVLCCNSVVVSHVLLPLYVCTAEDYVMYCPFKVPQQPPQRASRVVMYGLYVPARFFCGGALVSPFVCTLGSQDKRPADLHMAQPNVPVSKKRQGNFRLGVTFCCLCQRWC